MYKRWKYECIPISSSIFEPTCIFSLLYTVSKVSSISYPYQCLFAPSVQKGMGREKLPHQNISNKTKGFLLHGKSQRDSGNVSATELFNPTDVPTVIY